MARTQPSSTHPGAAQGTRSRETPVEHYYGLPAVKPSMYGWMVALYIFAGGLAGGVQIIATAVDLTGGPEASAVVTTGRVLALLGAVVGGILLIADLQTKQRFFNMLRIFRATSPMSIGTYVLMAFGLFSTLAVAGEILGMAMLATLCGAVAAVFGLAMVTYTAPLLSATSTPLWAAAPRLLACRFAASSLATGAAALVIAAWVAGYGVEEQQRLAGALSLIAALAVAVDLAAALVGEKQYRDAGLGRALRKPPWGPLHLGGALLAGSAVPLGLYVADFVLSPGAGLLALGASLLVLGGGVVMRAAIMFMGNESAKRPEDYLQYAGGGAR